MKTTMKKLHIVLVFVVLMMVACGGPLQQSPQQNDTISCRVLQPGDSTLYGLVCDGTTDSVLVLLSFAGGNPDTLDIIRAREEHRIYGRPHIGDEMAVLFVSDSTREVQMAVNVSTLQDEWCYMAYPTLRRPASRPASQSAVQPDSQQRRHLPDSILKRIMVPLEYTLKIMRDGTVRASGQPRQQTSDDRRPVDYPVLKRYAHWRLYNGRLILTPDSISQQLPDTADVLMLRRDSLVLRFRDKEQGYYRKVDTTKVVR